MFNKESYDNIYKTKATYQRHYTGLRFFPVWRYVASLVIDSPFVIDIGCGCGHLAHLLYDMGLNDLIGYDFSKEGIKRSREKAPVFKFIQSDLMEVDFVKATYVSTEVFEHIEDDKALISKLVRGCQLVFSVPNYKAPNHYRTYNGEAYIREYYKDLLNIKSVKEFKQNEKDSIFVIDSIVL